MDFFNQLFSNDFMPHGMCYMWKPGLLWLHVGSDALIFFAYTSIPITLLYLLKLRKDLIFSKVMVLFGAFVLLCGFTHLIAVWTVWNGTYWFSGSVKGITAIVSVATALMLWKLLPTLKSIPTVENLQQEVSRRTMAEEEARHFANKLSEQSIKLTETNEKLKTFAYASSHDLKSPLRGIQQLATWIKEDLSTENIKIPEETEQHLSLLQKRVSRMERLLDDLLIYSKAESTDHEFTTINCQQAFSDIFDLLKQNNPMELHFKTQLPEFETSTTPFTQIIRNLLDNSIKHNDKENGKVWVSAKLSGDFYQFTVEDNGPGVLSGDYEKITEAFTTLKPKDEVEGSGLGLAIIKKTLHSIGATMQLSKSEHGGLKVTFTWPTSEKLKSIINNQLN